METDNSASLLAQALETERARSQQLEDDNKALVSEFNKAENYEDVLKVAKEAIRDILPLAVTTAKSLIVSAESESVRAGLAKYVMDAVLSGKLDKDSDSAISDLINKLRENDPKFVEDAKALALKAGQPTDEDIQRLQEKDD